MLNRTNWVQQEQDIEYHVIKWKNSAFHDHHTRKKAGAGPLSGGVKAPMAAPSEAKSEPVGIGLGLDERIRDKRYRSGGFGESGKDADGVKDGRGGDSVSLSVKGAEQQSIFGQSAVEIMQPNIAEHIQSIAASAVNPTQEKKTSRLKKSAQKLREAYRKQHDKIAKIIHKKPDRPEEEKRQGTRRADKEEMLSMQAENHYLLDSYDKNGQYRMLGK